MNIAMYLTGSRLVIAPVFAWFFIIGFQRQSQLFMWVAIGLALALELTDMFDGMVARARNEVTDLGKVFDPVADSLSRQTLFISYMVTGIIPLWMYLIFFYRDGLIQLLRIVCASTGVVLAARPSGKFKAIVQAVATFAVLAVVQLDLYQLNILPADILGKSIGWWAVLLAAFVAFTSFFDYIIANRTSIAKMLERK